MTNTRKIIEIDEERCNGCGQCVPSCQEGAIQIINGKAKLVADKYCDGLGACLGECPTGALNIVEREAEEFDEQAVEEHLKQESPQPAPVPGGCPSARLKTFSTAQPAGAGDSSPTPSALSHWPVQIRLVPPTAPFLQGADLLVAADCVPIACADFHRDFLQGRVVMMGCPKFDDVELYEQRFTDIFTANDIQSITVMAMEVPCCQGLPIIVQRALQRAGKSVPFEVVRVSLEGVILERMSV